MEHALHADLPVGVYKSYDKIQNLKIRTKLRKVANVCLSEKDPLVFNNSDELELVNMMKATAISKEHTFDWQEKSDGKYSTTLEAEKCSEPGKKDNLTIRFISYADSDLLSSKYKRISCTQPQCKQNHLEIKMSKTKPKAKLPFSENETWQKPSHFNSKMLIRESTKTVEIPCGQTMIILAELSFEDSSNKEEIELCNLKMDTHHTLTVCPDFSRGKPYTFVNSRSETFEYEIDDVSSSFSEAQLQREKRIIEKIAQYKQKIKYSAITDFDFITPDSITITLNCEITSAQGFYNPDIFIHYVIQIPKGYKSNDVLEGSTETCRCKIIQNVQVAYYGYLFSLDVNKDETVDNEINLPLKIIFEVTSIDMWGNFRNEGYGYADISLCPGLEMSNISTWKLEPTSLRDKLQNFFIGGMPNLSDISYVIGLDGIKDSQLSKFGVQTRTSGMLLLKVAKILQNKVI